MITKDQLLESIIHECNVCKHLCGKLLPGGLRYKPTDKQRTTLELLRFISICAAGAAHGLAEGNWDWWEKAEAEAERMDADGFCAAMDRQIADLRRVFDKITSADFASKIVAPSWRPDDKAPLGVWLMNMALKWMVGYRMQLFLYAKAAGNNDIGTANCWHGIDRPKQP